MPVNREIEAARAPRTAPEWQCNPRRRATRPTTVGPWPGSSGPEFNAVPFNPANVVATAVGTAAFAFSDGNTATFTYTVNGVTQTKDITREVFQSPGTVCQ